MPSEEPAWLRPSSGRGIPEGGLTRRRGGLFFRGALNKALITSRIFSEICFSAKQPTAIGTAGLPCARKT
jgi:hypothetical protein